MLKGAQKRMIVVRTRDSQLFEEAYFVMRSNENSLCGHADMMTEAHRILEGNLPPPAVLGDTNSPHRRLHRLLWFTAGALLGGGIASLLWLWL